MADKPILFSAPMVRALLDGRKTQTRRGLNPQPSLTSFSGTSYIGKDGKGHSLRISVGDRLWVREAWRTQKAFDEQSPSEIVSEFEDEWGEPAITTFYEADGRCDDHSVHLWQQSQLGRLRASMHMPRCASRLTLIVTGVRVERLRDITREDAIAEGLVKMPLAPARAVEMGCDWGFEGDSRHGSPVSAYAALWDSINGEGAWNANPWVAVYSFTVHHGNIDQIGGAA
ncbi:hypothetical protein ACLE20_13205 [Rhizobium sp. YIM 134829]|uniref:hypothetical protein n=1 Tax=Rhizobium sp. YIM 134829 TaxID=3390453 RepID=UPI00397AC03D